jgi:hypothetical protein
VPHDSVPGVSHVSTLRCAIGQNPDVEWEEFEVKMSTFIGRITITMPTQSVKIYKTTT